MFFALAIAFDPRTRRCDLALSGGRLAMDATAATPMLIAWGTEARAEPDDTLPDGTTEGSLAAGFNPRRGWPGDAFGDGRRAGCRLWLIEREKLTDQLMLLAEGYGQDGLQPLADRHGATLDVGASRAAKNAMLLDARLGAEGLQIKVATA